MKKIYLGLVLGVVFLIGILPTMSGEFVYDSSFEPTLSSSTAAGIYQNGTFIWILEITTQDINKYNMDGSYIGKVTANNGRGDFARGLTGNGTYFFVTDYSADRIYLYLMNGTEYSSFSVNPPLTWNHGLCTDNNFIWATDLLDRFVYKFWMNGTYTDESFNFSAETGVNSIATSCAIADGFLWTASGVYGSNTLYKHFMNGTYTGNEFNLSGHGLEKIDHITSDGNTFWLVDSSSTPDTVYVHNVLADSTPPTKISLGGNGHLQMGGDSHIQIMG